MKQLVIVKTDRTAMFAKTRPYFKLTTHDDKVTASYRGNRLYILLKVLVLMFSLTVAAKSQEHNHRPGTESEMHDKFYAGWMMPADRTRSCCNKQDCFPTEARYDHSAGRWKAWSRVRQDWIVIPDRHIEREIDVPMGAHLCENYAGVLCFGVGNGT